MSDVNIAHPIKLDVSKRFGLQYTDAVCRNFYQNLAIDQKKILFERFEQSKRKESYFDWLLKITGF